MLPSAPFENLQAGERPDQLLGLQNVLGIKTRSLLQKIAIEGLVEEQAAGLEGGLDGGEERPIEVADDDDQVEARLGQRVALQVDTGGVYGQPFPVRGLRATAQPLQGGVHGDDVIAQPGEMEGVFTGAAGKVQRQAAALYPVAKLYQLGLGCPVRF